MTAGELLARLRERVTVIADGGDLVFHGKVEVLKPKVIAAIQTAKPALLALLALEATMDEQVAVAYRRLGQALPPGAVVWGEAHTPWLLAMDEAAHQWTESYFQHDAAGLTIHLRVLVGLVERLAGEYRQGVRQAALPLAQGR